MNKWGMIICLIPILMTACLSAQALPANPEPSLSLNPVYRDFFISLGDERILGNVISDPFEFGSMNAQFLEKGLLIFDPKANDGEPVKLWPIGNSMQIQEKPVDPPATLPPGSLYLNGHIIPKEFASFYEQLGGCAKIGLPITEVHFNPVYQRYEQYFEKIGFYRLKSDPLEAINLLGLGIWMCGEQCRPINEKYSKVDVKLISNEEFKKFILDHGIDFTGYPLDEFPADESSGYTSQAILRNIVLEIDAGEPMKVRVLPLAELFGIPPDPLTKPDMSSDMVFVPIENDQLGFNIPKEIYDYINLHGGFDISGMPVSRFKDYGILKRQCFTNMCILYDPSAENQQIYPEALGYPYRRIYHRDNRKINIQPDEKYNDTMDTFMINGSSIRIWEEYPSLPQDRIQVIHLEAIDEQNIPIKGIQAEITLQIPDQGEIVLSLLETGYEGKTQVSLPVLNVPKGTIIPYQVCITSQNKRECFDTEFVIWDNRSPKPTQIYP